jgi:hypothetical protein
MKKSKHIISFEEWVQTIEFEEGYLKRRREKDAYMENPNYIHPLYKTPLMEPYKPFPNSLEAKYEGKAIKMRNPEH